MISFLEGILKEKEPDKIIVALDGIGYEVYVPLTTLEKLPSPGEKVKLYTHFYVREQIQQLYGFVNQKERDLFRSLLDLPNIGPRLALAILSHFDPQEFRRTILSKNAKALSAVPGIGLKTAEKIIFELRDKVEGLAVEEEKREEFQEVEDAIAGLVSLGYRRHFAKEQIEKIKEKNKYKAEELIRLVLQNLAK